MLVTSPLILELIAKKTAAQDPEPEPTPATAAPLRAAAEAFREIQMIKSSPVLDEASKVDRITKLCESASFKQFGETKEIFDDLIQMIKSSPDLNEAGKVDSITILCESDAFSKKLNSFVIENVIKSLKQNPLIGKIKYNDIVEMIPQEIDRNSVLNPHCTPCQVIDELESLRFNQDVINFGMLTKKETKIQIDVIQNKVESFLSGIWVQGNKTTFN